MIERYIYAVAKELPRDAREKVSAELRRQIYERKQQLDGELSESEKIYEVLSEMGNPKLLARQYRTKERYLIGPKYFDKYMFVLKIVLLSILIGLSVVQGFSVIFSVNTVYDILGGYISSLLSALLQGTAWVTGIFALLEYNDISLNTKLAEEKWEPNQLPPIPKEKARISRTESVFAIIFSTLFLTLFFFAPDAIGIYWFLGSRMNFVPIFNLGELAVFRILIFVVFTLNILVELIKIIKGRWTRMLAIIISVLNVISAGVLIAALSNPDLWNGEMVTQFERTTTLPFQRLIEITTGVIIFVTLLEILTSLYKGYRYGTRD